jgi:glyoxylase-like metal-dependent hydrolase (beta-lactamase superfamily II)
MKKIVLFASGALLILGGLAAAQQNQNRPPQPDLSKAEIHSLKMQGQVWMLVGGGGNVAMQAGPDGVLLVDTMFAQVADKLLAEVRKISSGPLRYIVNTHFHPDHTGGNEALRKAGSTISGGNVAGDLSDAGQGAQILAHENLLLRMSAPTGQQAPTPVGAWPTSTYISEDKKLFFNNEGVQIIHMPKAHTDGDSIVYFRKSDVIATGDIFQTVMYPVIDVNAGGTINGTIEALNKIIDMIIPVYGQEGGTQLVPGHGRQSDLGDLINFREMATIVRDRVQASVNKGMTLDQVKASKPTFDYDPLFNQPGAFWTADQFVEAVFKTLKKQ